MKQKVKIIDHDANRAKMMRLLPQPEKAELRLLQRLERILLIEHSGGRFAMTICLR